MWMMFQIVKPEYLLTHAKIFSESYFNGVRSDPMGPKMWPQNS